MRKTLKNILRVGAIGMASILPMNNLKAQTESHEDTTAVETPEIRRDNLRFNTGIDLAHKSRFFGLPFLETPMYKQYVGVDYGNFSASATGIVNVNERRFFDVDSYIGASIPLSRNINANASYMRFDFDLNDGKGWQNAAMFSAGLSSTAPLNPKMTWNRLIGFGGGDYIEGEVSGNINPVNLVGRIGYNRNALRTGTGFTHTQLVASSPVQLTKGLTLTPRLDALYSTSPDANTGIIAGFELKYNF